MSQKLQPVRGTHDILPEESLRRRHVQRVWNKVAGLYAYGEITPPMFEMSEVFHRTLGDTSDVVSKETYTFTDRGGESLTLRPEFTAGVVRAFITGALTQDLPQKFAYLGPAFRYERPQKGRLRQFHQLGAELLGAAEPEADVESIVMAAHLLRELGLASRAELQLNTLGDRASREAYRAALVAYYRQHQAALSEDSRARLEKNPLRILDSKDAGDIRINVNAPTLDDYLTPESREFFEAVQRGLRALNVSFVLKPQLVRGLDYYNHTVFEFVAADGLGAQNTVLAGGRYDGLVALMGGPDVPGVGWAAGVERLLALMDFENIPNGGMPIAAVVPVGDEQEQEAWELAQELRKAGIAVDVAYKGNAGKRLKRANKIGARVALMLGEDEVKAGAVTMKILETGEQRSVPRKQLVAELHSLTKA